MRIWILEIGEPLPLEGDVRLHRYGQFSQFLAKAGHQVTWWTSSFSHAPKKHFAEADQDVTFNGVTLRMIRGFGYPRNISLARIRHNRHFAKRFSQLAPQYEAPDLIIAPIPILEAAGAAMAYAKARQIPVLTDIRDEWPDELKNLAPKPFRPFARLLLNRSYRAMTSFCRQVTGIMAVSERQLSFGLRFAGRPRQNTDLIFPHGYSPQKIGTEKTAQAESWWTTLGTKPEPLTLCFFGTLGQYFDFATVFTAFRELKNEIPLQLVIGGTGSSLEAYKKAAADLPNVIFAGWLEAPQIQVVMKHSQVGLAPYISDSAMSLPNKPFEYMSARLAIMSSIQSELAGLLARHHCGLTYLSNDVAALKQGLRQLYADPTETKAMGERGFQLWAAQFNTDAIFNHVTLHLEKVVQNWANTRNASSDLPLTESVQQDKQI
ncbi:MAG: glycosyltransferase family 4 protein [Bdellovibrionales bacterium]